VNATIEQPAGHGHAIVADLVAILKACYTGDSCCLLGTLFQVPVWQDQKANVGFSWRHAHRPSRHPA